MTHRRGKVPEVETMSRQREKDTTTQAAKERDKERRTTTTVVIPTVPSAIPRHRIICKVNQLLLRLQALIRIVAHIIVAAMRKPITARKIRILLLPPRDTNAVRTTVGIGLGPQGDRTGAL